MLVVALLLCGLTSCRPDAPLAARLEYDMLLRQKAALEREQARGTANTESAALVVVPAALLDQLLDVALPVQATVSDRFRITVDSARVEFNAGLALVHLAARVEWVDRENISANIEVLGTLQILDLDASSGTLVSRVEILGFEAVDVRVGAGALSTVAARLLEEFAERPASDLNQLLSRIEIPVRLVPTIRMPAVEENELSIDAVEIPMEARIDQVRVGSGRLWVYVGFTMTPPVQS